MANPNKSQGTAWETRIVKLLRSFGFKADRHPLRGIPGEPDIWVNDPHVYPNQHTWHVVAWKRMLGTKSKGRRSSVEVAILPWSEYVALLEMAQVLDPIQIQAKCSQRESVTALVTKLIDAVQKIWRE